MLINKLLLAFVFYNNGKIIKPAYQPLIWKPFTR